MTKQQMSIVDWAWVQRQKSSMSKLFLGLPSRKTCLLLSHQASQSKLDSGILATDQICTNNYVGILAFFFAHRHIGYRQTILNLKLSILTNIGISVKIQYRNTHNTDLTIHKMKLPFHLNSNVQKYFGYTRLLPQG